MSSYLVCTSGLHSKVASVVILLVHSLLSFGGEKSVLRLISAFLITIS